MKISARVHDHGQQHDVQVRTGDTALPLPISAKVSGRGSSINGGELLMAALATCYCNDLYREAARLGIQVDGCEVVASAQFNGVGLAAESVVYSAKVESSAAPEQIELLLAETDRLAEIHNTLRSGCTVQRVAWHDRRPEDS